MRNRVLFATLLVAVIGAVARSVERDPDTEAATGGRR
jgi:hypothetical protein